MTIQVVSLLLAASAIGADDLFGVPNQTLEGRVVISGLPAATQLFDVFENRYYLGEPQPGGKKTTLVIYRAEKDGKLARERELTLPGHPVQIVALPGDAILASLVAVPLRDETTEAASEFRLPPLVMAIDLKKNTRRLLALRGLRIAYSNTRDKLAILSKHLYGWPRIEGLDETKLPLLSPPEELLLVKWDAHTREFMHFPLAIPKGFSLFGDVALSADGSRVLASGFFDPGLDVRAYQVFFGPLSDQTRQQATYTESSGTILEFAMERDGTQKCRDLFDGRPQPGFCRTIGCSDTTVFYWSKSQALALPGWRDDTDRSGIFRMALADRTIEMAMGYTREQLEKMRLKTQIYDDPIPSEDRCFLAIKTRSFTNPDPRGNQEESDVMRLLSVDGLLLFTLSGTENSKGGVREAARWIGERKLFTLTSGIGRVFEVPEK